MRVEAILNNADDDEGVRPRRLNIIAALIAPAIGVFRVSRAASLLTRAGPVPLSLLTLVVMAMEGTLCVTLSLWEQTRQYSYQFVTSQSAGSSGSWQVESRTMADVWADWVARGNRNPAIGIFMGTAIGTLACIIVAIALFWPRVYRQGRLRPALRRTHAAVLATTGRALVLTAVVFSGYNLVSHWNLMQGLRWGSGLQPEHCAIVGVQSSILLMLLSISRATRAASDVNNAPDPPPQCEGCGYDLTHRPESGLCSECGASVEKSLEPGRGRKPADFDKATALPDAMSTTLDALFAPATFYRRLTVRIDPQRDVEFRLRHHLAIFAGAFVWIAILVVSKSHRSVGVDEVVGILAGSLGAAIAAWALQHIVGAVACFVWVVRRTLPDLRWGIRVINFETVYLWLFCTFNGMMITSFVMFDDWIGDLFGAFNQPTGIPNALLAVFIPNLAMIGFWFVRMLRNGRAVQWANF